MENLIARVDELADLMEQFHLSQAEASGDTWRIAFRKRALVKAALVAMYFMHLKFENRTLAMIAMTPPVLLAMFLFITYPDTAWRLFTQWAAH